MMKQQIYFLQQMGITVWKSNSIEENLSIKFDSSLLIVSKFNGSELSSEHTTLIQNIAKAMQLTELSWSQLTLADFFHCCKNERALIAEPIEWLWFIGLSESEYLAAKNECVKHSPQLKVVKSCELERLSCNKSEKASLWQQISKFLK